MATAKRVFFIPGFMGTALTRPRGPAEYPGAPRPHEIIWLDLPGILGGDKYALMGLPPPEGQELSVSGVIMFQGYSGFHDYFSQRQNWPEDWQLLYFPYDWRRSIRDSAMILAQRIAKEGGPPGFYSLVGHSMGAAVAVATWATLKAMGKDNLIGRIVTLAGVLWGSYSTQLSWAEYEDSLNLFSSVPCLARLLLPFGLVAPSQSYDSIYNMLLSKFMTWPGTYDLAPNPAAPDDPSDVHRGLWYDPEAWNGSHMIPDFSLANLSLANYHAWRIRPENIPPRSVCVHYVASGERTAVQMRPSAFHGLRASQFAGRPGSWAQRKSLRQAILPQFVYGDGDNRLSPAAQKFAGNYTIGILGEHASVQHHPAFLRSLVGTLRDPIPGTEAPPVTVPVPRQFPQLVLEERTVEPRTAIAVAYAETPQVVPSSPRRPYFSRRRRQ